MSNKSNPANSFETFPRSPKKGSSVSDKPLGRTVCDHFHSYTYNGHESTKSNVGNQKMTSNVPKVIPKKFKRKKHSKGNAPSSKNKEVDEAINNKNSRTTVCLNQSDRPQSSPVRHRETISSPCDKGETDVLQPVESSNVLNVKMKPQNSNSWRRKRANNAKFQHQSKEVFSSVSNEQRGGSCCIVDSPTETERSESRAVTSCSLPGQVKKQPVLTKNSNGTVSLDAEEKENKGKQSSYSLNTISNENVELGVGKNHKKPRSRKRNSKKNHKINKHCGTFVPRSKDTASSLYLINTGIEELVEWSEPTNAAGKNTEDMKNTTHIEPDPNKKGLINIREGDKPNQNNGVVITNAAGKAILNSLSTVTGTINSQCGTISTAPTSLPSITSVPNSVDFNGTFAQAYAEGDFSSSPITNLDQFSNMSLNWDQQTGVPGQTTGTYNHNAQSYQWVVNQPGLATQPLPYNMTVCAFGPEGIIPQCHTSHGVSAPFHGQHLHNYQDPNVALGASHYTDVGYQQESIGGTVFFTPVFPKPTYTFINEHGYPCPKLVASENMKAYEASDTKNKKVKKNNRIKARRKKAKKGMKKRL